MIIEIVQRRGLTSCMNNTKWREFREAMEYEMPFKPPYIYKTLLRKRQANTLSFQKMCLIQEIMTGKVLRITIIK